MRAAHQLLDRPKVFDDPMALRIVGAQGEIAIRLGTWGLKTRFARCLRAFVVARSRIAEDELSAAVSRGVRQYVILGAGFDTFAYRNPYSGSGLRVFEVDTPATQEWKRRRLKAAKMELPESLKFVAVNFNSQSLAEQLQRAEFRMDEPSVFSWLGVTMYLTGETVMGTLRHIASSAPSGSGIVFDYVVSPSLMEFSHRIFFRALTYRMALVGEPWVGFFDPKSLAADLKTMGFSDMEDIGSDGINARFFDNREDKLKVGRYGHLMKAKKSGVSL
jgi:methyltransferase (TIGR00027 family)